MLYGPIIRDAVGIPLRWRDAQGVLHAAMGTHSDAGEGFQMWTRCDGRRVPADNAWSGRRTPTCLRCAEVEQAERMQVVAAETGFGNAAGPTTVGNGRPG